jgi:penicillin-binding protein
MALSSTPSEFIAGGGTGVNAEFMERMLGPWKGDASKLFSSKSGFSSNVVSGAIFDADASNPAAVNVVLGGSSISWSNSASNDVIGYYVYRDGARVGTVRESSANSYSIGSGSYTVRAVDITGRLSGSSNTVTVAAPEPIIVPEVVEPTPETTPTPPAGTPSTPPSTPGTTPPPSNPGGENPGGGSGTTPPSDDDGED